MRRRWNPIGLLILLVGITAGLGPLLTAPWNWLPRGVKCEAGSAIQFGADRFWIEELSWRKDVLHIQWRHRVLPAEDEEERAQWGTLAVSFLDRNGTLLTTTFRRHRSSAAILPVRPMTEEAEI